MVSYILFSLENMWAPGTMMHMDTKGAKHSLDYMPLITKYTQLLILNRLMEVGDNRLLLLPVVL